MKLMFSSVSPKGQVTIPAPVRRLLDVRPKDKVGFKVANGQVEIVSMGSSLDSLYRSFPAIAKPLSDREMTDLVAEEHSLHVAEEGLDR